LISNRYSPVFNWWLPIAAGSDSLTVYVFALASDAPTNANANSNLFIVYAPVLDLSSAYEAMYGPNLFRG
jgi:hypothetical protein